MTNPLTDTPLRITLVAIHPQRSTQAVPLAAAFLAAAIRRAFAAAVRVTIVDLYADQPPDECAAAIRATRPDLAGFSVYLWNRRLCAAVARLLQAPDGGPTLCGGGPEASADPDGLLAEAPWDFLIRGEGEAPLVAAVGQLLQGGDCRRLPPAAPVATLDELPSPLLDGILDPARYDGMLWQLSRGCSFGCDFCYDGGGSRRVRRFSLARLEAELRWLVASGVSQVFVLDSTFNADRQRAGAILRLIARLAPRIHFHFEVRSECLDREQAQLFAAITCSLQIGLQSGSGTVLQRVGRPFSRADFVSRVQLLNESGAIFGFDLIYGLPQDSLVGFRESLDFALSLLPNHLDIFPLALLPGTRLTARAADLGLRALPSPPYSLLASPGFPAEDLAQAGRLAAACDLFYSRGKAVAWFMTVLAPLRVKPSELLACFADYLDTRGIDGRTAESMTDDAIADLQADFIAARYAAAGGAMRLLPLALDLIAYHHHYAAALLAVPPVLPGKRALAQLRPEKLCLRLAPSTRLARFNHDILELLAAECGDLQRLARRLRPVPSMAVIYPCRGEVRTEAFHPEYVRLLERLDGSRPLGALVREMRLPVADTLAFVRFIIGEGIALTVATGGGTTDKQRRR